MSKKRIFVMGIMLLVALMFTGCALYRNDSDDFASSYRNLGSGDNYYRYPYYQGYWGEEQYPVIDAHGHHHHH